MVDQLFGNCPKYFEDCLNCNFTRLIKCLAFLNICTLTDLPDAQRKERYDIVMCQKTCFKYQSFRQYCMLRQCRTAKATLNHGRLLASLTVKESHCQSPFTVRCGSKSALLHSGTIQQWCIILKNNDKALQSNKQAINAIFVVSRSANNPEQYHCTKLLSSFTPLCPKHSKRFGQTLDTSSNSNIVYITHGNPPRLGHHRLPPER